MRWAKTNPGTLLKGWTADKLAACAERPGGYLEMLARNTEVMYGPAREQLKSSGGTRIIDPPLKKYKALLRLLTRILSNLVPMHPAAHGGVRGRSSFTSARVHLGAKFMAVRDIKDCYPSISPGRLYAALARLGASHDFAGFLARLMTVRGRVPQGGPLSSLAINLFFWRQDAHFDKNARKTGGRFTRLADDFVATARSRDAAVRVGNEIDNAIAARGLRVNERKREKKGLLCGDREKVVHSLVVNNRRGLTPKRDHVKVAIELAERYARRCRCATPAELEAISSLRDKTTGMMYYMQQSEFSPAKHIRRMVLTGDREVLCMLRRCGLAIERNQWWGKQAKRLCAQWERMREAKRAG